MVLPVITIDITAIVIIRQIMQRQQIRLDPNRSSHVICGPLSLIHRFTEAHYSSEITYR
jgi:hypothetical protein